MIALQPQAAPVYYFPQRQARSLDWGCFSASKRDQQSSDQHKVVMQLFIFFLTYVHGNRYEF